jgi:hypothetical protein
MFPICPVRHNGMAEYIDFLIFEVCSIISELTVPRVTRNASTSKTPCIVEVGTMRDMESWAVCYCHFKKCQCKCTFTVIMIDIFNKTVKLT